MIAFVPWNPRRNTSTAPDTASLLRRLAQGDHAALDQLYRREAGPVYRYALALGGDAAWAADATQDAFIALATQPAAFDAGRGSLGAYLAGIARHTLLARWRQQRGEQPLPDDEDDGDMPTDTGSAPETLLVRAQSQAAVWQALRQLPAPQREAVVLVDLQERPYAEAAQVAGVELNTLRTRLHRARLKLAALLAAGPGDPR